MQIIVMGGTGFIVRSLCAPLCQTGHRITPGEALSWGCVFHHPKLEPATSAIGLSKFTLPAREMLRAQTRTSIVVHNKEVFT